MVRIKILIGILVFAFLLSAVIILAGGWDNYSTVSKWALLVSIGGLSIAVPNHVVKK